MKQLRDRYKNNEPAIGRESSFRRNGAILLAASVLAACGPSSQSGSPDVQAVPKVDETEIAAEWAQDYSIDLKARAWQPLESFTVKDRTVKVLTEERVTSTSLTRAQIEIRTAQSLALESIGQMEMTVGTQGDPIGVRYRVQPAAYEDHKFVLLRSPQEVSDAAQLPTTGAITKVHYSSDGSSTGAVSLIGQYPEGEYGLANVHPDDFNLAVETCQNMVDVQLIEATIPITDQKTQATLTKLAKESVCNGMALAAAAHDAGYSYEEYSERSAGAYVGDKNANLGMKVPYAQLPKSYWATL